MKVLSLSTAEQGASLAVFDGASLICEEYWVSRLTHSRRLVSMVDGVVRNRAGFDLESVDAFIAAKGPGSFTGLRIGISVVKGLAYALSKPCAGVSSLDGIAWRFCHSQLPVCAMMDARRGEVYSAIFRFSQGRLVEKTPETVCPPDKVVAYAGKAPVLYAGSGSKAYQDLISHDSGQSALFSCPDMDYVSASALARQIISHDSFFDRDRFELVPSYIRRSDAEIHFGKSASVLT
mgnify:CR=1 FL=1